jgi:hypothetical protein
VVVGADGDDDNKGAAYAYWGQVDAQFPWELFYPAFIKKK